MTVCSRKASIVFTAVLIFGIATVLFPLVSAWAASNTPESSPNSGSESAFPESWLKKTGFEWGGEFKVRGAVSWPDRDSLLGGVSSGPYYGGSIEGRLKANVYLSKKLSFETHYEIVLSGGDTRRIAHKLEEQFPALFGDSVLVRDLIDDDRRLLDLTGTLDEDDSYILYHRLDRLFLTWLPYWGTVRIGRQAVTWGNGLLFNPMDLFNPFAPTDIERDYKIGDDIVNVEIPVKKLGDVQILYVARRDPADGEVKWSETSLAAKLHFAKGITEFDLMSAKHYEDVVVGAGAVGYIGDAAWRANATWTFLDDEEGLDGYLSFVANMDYSWIWWGKNWYGFLEFYYNGLGEDKDDYAHALFDPDVAERIERGELFTLGRLYLVSHVRMEVHPLLNLYLTVMNNLQDPSGTVQPRAVWDVMEDVQITVGGTLFYGGKGTEYGGFKLPGTDDFLTSEPQNAFLWVTYYF
jgi:hypothetical protein